MTEIRFKTILVFAALICCLVGTAVGEDAPMSICRYRLGENISAYKDRIDWESVMPIRYQPYLREAEIIPDKEFKTGLITFGDCAVKGRIMRIKLKYIDNTEAFYKKLLTRYKRRFGEPDDWRGDAFGVVKAWKWSFKDASGRSISLILQHNHLDREQKMGNSVKLSLSDYFDEEYRCYQNANPEFNSENRGPRRLKGDLEWDRLIPQ
ncbi:hypothetical protein [Desulfosarcina ovata]|uniref:Uncharacterized protein n=2 Tax=Desulfosarcina ovata TaxID=83564 RepID=A0A5K8AL76_9BACT|nr:hypothetical protein [Desulfosarcina ovata]BBO86607.1 hypothetical protein DSCO28_71730 [Desulfosarcina ovata subsp. sediminis]BBO93463.1 hypothetical protein DSCOOX_66430 [Desulfosarcina ovata subsp. ovata]